MNATNLFRALCVVAAILFLADLGYHKHPYSSWEKLLGAYGLFGLFGSAVLLLAAGLLRKLVMREDDYYDR